MLPHSVPFRALHKNATFKSGARRINKLALRIRNVQRLPEQKCQSKSATVREHDLNIFVIIVSPKKMMTFCWQTLCLVPAGAGCRFQFAVFSLSLVTQWQIASWKLSELCRVVRFRWWGLLGACRLAVTSCLRFEALPSTAWPLKLMKLLLFWQMRRR